MRRRRDTGQDPGHDQGIGIVKAIVQDRYGPPLDVLRIEDVDEPRVGESDVLVRVAATAANPADWHLVRGEPYLARLTLGVRGPRHRIPGCDVSGSVVAVGSRVTRFRAGDPVFGSPFGRGFGAFAELASVPEDCLALKPPSLSHAEAAAVPLAALTALQALRDDGRIRAGHRVLVIGASGGVGTFAVQIAKAYGAEVTGTASTANLDLVSSLGADHVVDHTREDVTASYDVVLHLGGAPSLGSLRRLVHPGGTLLLVGGDARGRWVGPLGRLLRGRIVGALTRERIALPSVTSDADDLELLAGLLDRGTVRPVLGRDYAFADIPAAVDHVAHGHTRGKVVLHV
jgi:NADPH:quinone reductase-like Zn-dependent oxidoreductase